MAPKGRGRIDVAVGRLRWRRLGPVGRDRDGRLAFPPADQVPALYRLRVRSDPEQHYIGETDKLRRRLGQFRSPGSTQATNRRINGLLLETLEEGGQAEVDVATDPIEVWRDGAAVEVDLDDKWTRRLLESAGVLGAVHAGYAVLNR